MVTPNPAAECFAAEMLMHSARGAAVRAEKDDVAARFERACEMARRGELSWADATRLFRRAAWDRDLIKWDIETALDSAEDLAVDGTDEGMEAAKLISNLADRLLPLMEDDDIADTSGQADDEPL